MIRAAGSLVGVSEPRRRRVDVILDPAYLSGVADRSLDDLRQMHGECLEVETEFSYVRRLAQARIGIVTAERDRRAAGGSVGDLLSALPRILADDFPRPAPEHTRIPRLLAPAPNIQWRRGLEYLINDATLVNLPTISDDEIRRTLAKLAELEEDTSKRRREIHAVIDVIEAELAARHVSHG
jgi:hypothetical protein